MAKAAAISPTSSSAARSSAPTSSKKPRASRSRPAPSCTDALVKLGYADAEQVMGAIAEFHGMQFIDLDRSHHPRRRHRTRARIGRPRKRRPAPLAGERRAQDHHERPQRLRHRPEAAVHPEQRYPARPGRRASRSSRPSTATMARPKPNRWTRCSPSSPTRPSTSPKPKRPRASRRPTRATPRSSSSSISSFRKRSACGPATSTSSRSPTASASATASTACWSSATARRAACWPR